MAILTESVVRNPILSIYDRSASVCLSLSEHFAIFHISQKLFGQVIPALVQIILMEIEL